MNIKIHFKISKNYKIKAFQKNDLLAKVSFYHKSFHGKRTSSGQVLDNTKFTAAHQSLAFGTKVLLTNPRNHKSVIVTVNDRGRLPKGVQFDLTRAAFKKLGSHSNGYLRVQYKILPKSKLRKKR